MARIIDSIIDIIRVVSYGLSFVFPRDKSLWCFGSSFGFSNNAKYLYTYLLDNPQSGIKPIWVANNTQYKELVQMGVPCVKRWSLKGVWTTLRSGTYIFDSYVSDINIYTSGNTTKVNLWHGVGIKNIERKISSGPLKRIFDSKNPFVKLRHLNQFIRPNIFLTTSALMTEHFSKCFAIKKEICVESCYPRNYIFTLKDEKLHRYISKYESKNLEYLMIDFAKYKKIYLYMPTWRDSGKDFLRTLSLDFNKINEIMKRTNSLFLFKPHPATKLSQNFNKLSNLKIIDNKTDIYPIMPQIDSFITDYSSVYYDWLLIPNKEYIFYIPDLKEYISSERDIAFPFEEYTEGLKLSDFTSFIKYLKGEIKWDAQNVNNKINNIHKQFWGDNLQKSNQLEYLVEAIANNKIIN